MNSIALRIYFQMFLIQLPILIVCLGACIVILCRWNKRSSWTLWALFGFGLGLIISIGAPFTQACAQSWVLQSGNIPRYTWVFPVLGGFWSVLHACVYILLFVAVFEGRKQ
jgi:hypothetical protein